MRLASRYYAKKVNGNTPVTVRAVPRRYIVHVCHLGWKWHFELGNLREVISFNHHFPLITLTLKIISVRCIPLNLRSKTRRRATLLLPTWIYSCQSVETVNHTLPFTTNVTIFISIFQTFRSWAATSHLHPPMAFLSHNSSDTPGLAPLMNVSFWGRCDFPISFSGRDMWRNVWDSL